MLYLIYLFILILLLWGPTPTTRLIPWAIWIKYLLEIGMACLIDLSHNYAHQNAPSKMKVD